MLTYPDLGATCLNIRLATGTYNQHVTESEWMRLEGASGDRLVLAPAQDQLQAQDHT